MGWFKKNDAETNLINWKNVTSQEGVDTYNDLSFKTPVVFFKHSTRCSISSMAKRRLERGWQYGDEIITPIYLDLLSYRNVSNYLSEKYGIDHESPQILLIKNGICVYHASHSGITAEDLKDYL